MGRTMSGTRWINPPANNEEFNDPELLEDDEQWSWDIEELLEGICQPDPPCSNGDPDDPNPIKSYK